MVGVVIMLGASHAQIAADETDTPILGNAVLVGVNINPDYLCGGMQVMEVTTQLLID